MTNSFKTTLILLIVFSFQICFAQELKTAASVETKSNIVKDIEGNIYHIVVIGKQVWLQENLRTHKYRNGKPIAKNLSNNQWALNKTGACAVYNNDSIKENAFGLLYNWYAIANPAGLCPTGWHVPKDTEWNQMVKYLDEYADTTEQKRVQSEVAGGQLKEIGITHWASPNTGATGTANFLGFSGGNKGMDGKCNDVGAYGYWWTATASSNAEAYGRLLSYFNGNIDRFKVSKNIGFSVRCIKNKK
ncbi:MAG: fibrobacter succinogenes major paralogous domain-containing protein [Bacteroidota bacterium]